MENTKEIKLNDFYQAVILKTLGFPLLRLERGQGKFVTFIFDDPDFKAEAIIQQYWDRQVTVVARDLIESINELKTRIHTGV